MLYSLAMEFVRLDDGSWLVEAPWLNEPVSGPSYEAAYWAAMAARAASG